ncbi:hypothetical protein R6Z02_15740 [Carnobacterium maltaromaticum]|uniref:CopG family transcriptional regulator n=1 Tax=Carnobacterium maltaromaticum TaxID=2751 RepID=A0AAW9K915_CARML|nr:hypothetical protein [Carnobacterium maltaromaticum]MDW5525205.1 hypothetical protein [Carnobacterium maltaromaticum]MDZ5760679.1 hypothetical protein [Carnobacterium maltaromaticum]
MPKSITVKKLPGATVVALNELATKAGVSQNVYVKTLLQNHVDSVAVHGAYQRFEHLVNQTAKVIEKNTDVLEKFIEINS